MQNNKLLLMLQLRVRAKLTKCTIKHAAISRINIKLPSAAMHTFSYGYFINHSNVARELSVMNVFCAEVSLFACMYPHKAFERVCARNIFEADRVCVFVIIRS